MVYEAREVVWLASVVKEPISGGRWDRGGSGGRITADLHASDEGMPRTRSSASNEATTSSSPPS